MTQKTGDVQHLANQFLIAMPGMVDENFAGSVIYLCDHSSTGAMGLVINKPTDVDLATVFDKLTHGYYVQCQFKGTNKTLAEIKNRIAVSETIFRQLTVTLDSVQSDKPAPERKPMRKAAAPVAAAATEE